MSEKVHPVTRSDEFLAYQVDRIIKAQIEIIKELRKSNQLLEEINRNLPDTRPVAEEKPPAEETKPKRTRTTKAKKGE